VVNIDAARLFGHRLPDYGYLARITDISATVDASGLRCLL
jgi:hypothetical protein